MTFGIFTGPGRPWTLFHVSGIPIRVHRMLGYLLAFVLGSALVTQGLGAVFVWAVLLGGVLTSVTLHELGHALVAQRHGIEVVDITLWPLGGVAMLREMPESPRVEARVAAAGPAVNLVLAGIAALGLSGLGLAFTYSTTAAKGLQAVLGAVLWVNLVMGLFNLLPAFPMDGGKLLRSALATRMGWLRGTELAADVGRVLAWAMVVGGIFYSPMLPLLGLYLLFAGGRERLAVRLRHGAAAGGFSFAGGADLAEALRRMTQAQTQEGMGGDPEGVWRDTPAGARTVDVDVDPADAAARAPHAPPRPGGGGFSDEDVRRLEAFRGRLPRDARGDGA